MPALGKLPISSIRSKQLQEVDDATAWTTSKTRKNAISSLRQVFAFEMSKQAAS